MAATIQSARFGSAATSRRSRPVVRAGAACDGAAAVPFGVLAPDFRRLRVNDCPFEVEFADNRLRNPVGDCRTHLRSALDQVKSGRPTAERESSGEAYRSLLLLAISALARPSERSRGQVIARSLPSRCGLADRRSFRFRRRQPLSRIVFQRRQRSQARQEGVAAALCFKPEFYWEAASPSNALACLDR